MNYTSTTGTPAGELEEIAKRMTMLEQELKSLQGQIAELESKPTALELRRLTYSGLMLALQAELLEVDKVAQSQSEGPTSYVVSEFTLTIKALASVDEKGRPILAFPIQGEVDPGQLSSLTIRLSPVPRFTKQIQRKSSA
ncbi:hypothetical protein HS1genome_1132 [Sulfodiicoccus acidiphilus]|uniref:Uncharacterized protein n=1 Tax=Sulfodiicoccus acidiphilus TaxID=1670455 RepID=A0A348B3J1_9CREN|nr:hypothetical protein [Sulfodiicoccus acidiphilus]BBD72743.1 hypothetical protein HS1genome_1132 [Sulfodiicoccus acidiphilus]GGT95132.1 hypothetical protein GCM10007116_10750 [Sulfodiicoccus acidiphilus]